MIPSIHIHNFKCLKDFHLSPGKFCVLVGQNESGKTAFLEAIRLAYLGVKNPHNMNPLVSQEFGSAFTDDAVWRKDPTLTVAIEISDAQSNPDAEFRWKVHRLAKNAWSTSPSTTHVDRNIAQKLTDEWLAANLGSVAYYRFNPQALKVPDRNMTQGELSIDGAGFPGFLNSFLHKDREAFRKFENEFYDRFPMYRHIELRDTVDRKAFASTGYSLRFHTRQGTDLPASAISDGAILSLAYTAICHQPDPPQVLLLEEPENGVHHARLREIVDTLKHLSKTQDVQVILTTHSPYLLDLVEPEDVRVFVKDEEGAAHAIRLSDMPDVDAWRKNFMTGEIWTSLSPEEWNKKVVGGGNG